MNLTGCNPYLYLLILTLFVPQNFSLRGQSFDSRKIIAGDSVYSVYRSHGLPLMPIPGDSQFISRNLTHINIEFEFTPKISTRHFYNPKNVIPENPFMLDYRSSSYYTPKIVQDRLDFFMNRPPADSFVPLPVVAVLGAKLAMHYLDIEKKLELHAGDYILNETDLAIMKELWERSPRTLEELYSLPSLHHDSTFETLASDVNRLVDSHLVKRRDIEAGPVQYFAAQTRQKVILMLREALPDTALTIEERNRLSRIITELQR